MSGWLLPFFRTKLKPISTNFCSMNDKTNRKTIWTSRTYGYRLHSILYFFAKQNVYLLKNDLFGSVPSSRLQTTWKLLFIHAHTHSTPFFMWIMQHPRNKKCSLSASPKKRFAQWSLDLQIILLRYSGELPTLALFFSFSFFQAKIKYSGCPFHTKGLVVGN